MPCDVFYDYRKVSFIEDKNPPLLSSLHHRYHNNLDIGNFECMSFAETTGFSRRFLNKHCFCVWAVFSPVYLLLLYTV